MNLLTSDIHSQPLLIFLHLPKTAGSTLARVIERQYSAELCLAEYQSCRGQELAAIPRHEMGRFRVVMGHFYFGLHTVVPGPFTYITMLRDPIERVSSFYYYVRREPDHYLYEAAQEMNLREFVIACGAAEPNNDQTRLLAATEYSIETGNCSPEALPLAKRHLRDYFAVVGLTEAFDQSLLLMRRALGWRMPFYIKQNVTKRRPGKKDVPAETRRVIQAHNELDSELYAYGRALFKEQLRLQAGVFKQELQMFRAMNVLSSTLYLLMTATPNRVRRERRE